MTGWRIFAKVAPDSCFYIVPNVGESTAKLVKLACWDDEEGERRVG
jgi:hypothetical protein